MEHELVKSETHFDYLDFRLSDKKIKAIKQKFSQATEMQPSFLSQVLSRKFSLSMEQAIKACEFFKLSKIESHYFLMLVSRDRATTESLKAFFSEQIENFTDEAFNNPDLNSQLRKNNEVTSVYYSCWTYMAIHGCCALSGVKGASDIAQRLDIPLQIVNERIAFLEENKFIYKSGQRYKSRESWVRLTKNSPFRNTILTSWKHRALQNSTLNNPDDVHYVGTYALDQQSYETLKKKVKALILESTLITKDSKEEDLIFIGLDLFKLTHSLK